MKIGRYAFGIRGFGTWYKYLIPKETQGKHHEYFQWGIWWLKFYLYKVRKCDQCGRVMDKSGGVRVYDINDNFVNVICKKCKGVKKDVYK